MKTNIKKITMMLFVAASMLMVASCGKDDTTTDTPGGGTEPAPYQAKESDIIGTWSVPSSSPYLGGKKLEYKADHTMNVISDYSTRTHQVWTLTGNTLESTFTSTPDEQGRTWWEKITLNVQNYEEVENTQNDYTDKYLTVEGLMTTNYNASATNPNRIDTLGLISGRLSQRVRH